MKNFDENSDEFRKYREEMHGVEADDDDRKMHAKPVRVAFAVLMVIIYIGVGILLLINWFNYPDSQAFTIGRYVVGIVLIIYGIWRAYRQFAGIDSRF